MIVFYAQAVADEFLLPRQHDLLQLPVELGFIGTALSARSLLQLPLAYLLTILVLLAISKRPLLTPTTVTRTGEAARTSVITRLF